MKSKKNIKGFQLKAFDISYSDLSIAKNKLLIGSDASCDLVISSPSISSYHAMIVHLDDGILLVDLESNNGTFVNGESIQRHFVCDGDHLKFADVDYRVEETILATFVDVDKDVVSINSQSEAIPVAIPEKTGLVLIDDEYCDIVFDEMDVSPVISDNHFNVDFSNFVDPYEPKEDVQSIKDSKEKLAIEISTLNCSNIIDFDIIEASSARKLNKILNQHITHVFGEEAKANVSNSSGKFLLSLPESLNKRNVTKEENLNSSTIQLSVNETVSVYKGSNEVTLKLVNLKERVLADKFFTVEKELYKEGSKVLGAVLSIALLLLLVDTNIPKPEKKKEFVIYKKAIPAKEVTKKSTENVAKKDVDNGSSQKNDKVIKKAVAKNDPKPVKKTKPKKIKRKLTKVKPVKKVTPKKVVKKVRKIVKAKPKPKFKLKLRKSLKGMLAQTDVSKITSKTATTSALPNENAKVGKLASNSGAKTMSNLGSGTNLSGNYDKSKGIRGLASKRGVEMANTSRKTVVLGSMDPELLRKILREYLPQFRHCYQSELDKKDNSQGTVDLNFRINGAGRVSSVNIGGADFSKGTVNCLGSVLKLIQFPRPKGGGVVDVKQPLNFSSSKNRI